MACIVVQRYKGGAGKGVLELSREVRGGMFSAGEEGLSVKGFFFFFFWVEQRVKGGRKKRERYLLDDGFVVRAFGGGGLGFGGEGLEVRGDFVIGEDSGLGFEDLEIGHVSIILCR